MKGLMFLLLALSVAFSYSKSATVNTTNGVLNLRSGPGVNHSIRGYMSKGQEVTIDTLSNKCKKDGWVTVVYTKGDKRLTGCAYEKLLKTGGPYQRYVDVKTTLRVRSGSNKNTSQIGSLSKGEKVKIYEERGGFVRISKNEDRWVSKQFLSTSKPLTTKVIKYVNTKSGSLNIRNNADDSSNRVGSLSRGDVVTVFTVKNGFSKIGKDKWVASKYLSSKKVKIAPEHKLVDVSSTLNVRTGPGKSYRNVEFVARGHKFTIYERKNGYAKISKDSERWVSEKYLTTEAKFCYNCKLKGGQALPIIPSGNGLSLPYAYKFSNKNKCGNKWIGLKAWHCALGVRKALQCAGLNKRGALGDAIQYMSTLKSIGFKKDMRYCNVPGVVRVYRGLLSMNKHGRNEASAKREWNRKYSSCGRFYKGDLYGHVDILTPEKKYISSFKSSLSRQSEAGYCKGQPKRKLVGCFIKK